MGAEAGRQMASASEVKNRVTERLHGAAGSTINIMKTLVSAAGAAVSIRLDARREIQLTTRWVVDTLLALEKGLQKMNDYPPNEPAPDSEMILDSSTAAPHPEEMRGTVRLRIGKSVAIDATGRATPAFRFKDIARTPYTRSGQASRQRPLRGAKTARRKALKSHRPSLHAQPDRRL